MANLEELANQLKLTYIRDNAETLITEARHKQQDYAEFLEMLLIHEAEKHTNNRNRKISAPVRVFLRSKNYEEY